MDQYPDVIPDDRGEEIRRLVRERDGVNTTFLPPGGPKEQDEEQLEPPRPEDDLKKYDRNRLENGLRFLHGATKRKVTPRTKEFLKLHDDAYVTALDDTALVRRRGQWSKPWTRSTIRLRSI
jgi:hypothetical protein